MPDYRIGVVAHQRRETQAVDLAALVKADHVGWDSDQQAMGGDRNHLNVWTALSRLDSEWSIVLEDDAQPIDGFRPQLEQALSNAPTPILSLYLGQGFPIWWQPGIKQAIDKAEANNASYIVTHTLLHCVGVAIRTDFVPMITGTPQQPHAWPIDEHISYVAQRHLPQPAIAYTFPSLINHADGPTVIRTHNDGMERPPGRTAWRTGPRDTWNDTTVDMAPQ